MCVAGLGEFRIRDLNDHINKLLREKQHWQERIVELGGTNYNVSIMYMQELWGEGGGATRFQGPPPPNEIFSFVLQTLNRALHCMHVWK